MAKEKNASSGMPDKQALKYTLIALGVFAVLAVLGASISSIDNTAPSPYAVEPTVEMSTPSESNNQTEETETWDDYSGFEKYDGDDFARQGSYTPSDDVLSACEDKAIINGYSAASIVFGLDHPAKAWDNEEYTKDGHLIWMVEFPMKDKKDENRMLSCYITNEKDSQSLLWLVDSSKTISGSLSGKVYDKNGNKTDD